MTLHAFLLLFVIIFGDWSQTGYKIQGMRAVNQERLKSNVEKICTEFFPRDYLHTEQLDSLSSYIKREFLAAGGRVSEQTYTVQGRIYRNIISEVGKEQGEVIIVGAHYDAAGEFPGADDNASAVAGLIELAHLLRHHVPDCPVNLVAYSTEEPPFFGTRDMGSSRHSDLLKSRKTPVKVMICLEMIGYFTSTPGSQKFPVDLMKFLYPDQGDFILVAGLLGQENITDRIVRSMKKAQGLGVEVLSGPLSVHGIDFSDHRNYWNNGYNAVMITDTSFYRNPNYHTAGDAPDTLDYHKMGLVVEGVFQAILDLGAQ